MSSIKIEFTPEQLNNLKIFLLRADLKGSEVEQFIEIANLLNTENVKETNDNDGN
jgi:hypothetical protein